MNKQFYYTRKEKVEKPQINGEDQPEEFKEFQDSFNLEYVVRSVDYGTSGRLVLLDDFHEEMRDVPQFNKKREFVGTKKERNTYCSEIMLSEEDGKRFIEATK